MNRILERVYSEECGVRKDNRGSRGHFLKAQTSLVETTVRIDESVSKEAFRRGWRIQFNTSKDWIELVKFITFLFDKRREAKHVYEQNERRLKRLHRVPAAKKMPRALERLTLDYMVSG
jgi:hypothetical protein